MTNPWQDQAPEPTPPAKPHWGLWLVLLGSVLAIIFAMTRAFPERSLEGYDWMNVLYLVGFAALISSGALYARRGDIARHLKYAAIWAAIVALLVVGLAFQEELAGVPQRLRLAFSAGDPVAVSERELVIPGDESGHYLVVGQVDGQRVRFLVDTGSSATVLSPADARRIGVDVKSLNYGYESQTANGKGYGAKLTPRTLEIGPIREKDFELMVNQAPMGVSLLGIDFLNRLESYEFRRGKLILRWKGEA